jgi:hypothetical protein
LKELVENQYVLKRTEKILDDKALIKVLLAIIFGLVTWSAHREMGRLDTQIEVLHKRVNSTLILKADKDDFTRELSYIWKEINRLREK